jgi:hypothetical protein
MLRILRKTVLRGQESCQWEKTAACRKPRLVLFFTIWYALLGSVDISE